MVPDSAEIKFEASPLGGGTIVQPPLIGNWEDIASRKAWSDRWKEQEQKSAKVLVVPAAKTGSNVKCNERVRLANQRRT